MRVRIGFTSTLSSEYLDELEKLLFFNPQQNRALPGISESISQYGVPGICVDEGRLRIRLANLPGAQTLFALDDSTGEPELVGVMIFARVDLENITLLHIAVREDYSRFGSRAGAGLVPKMMEELRAIARKLKGVQSIQLKYAKGLTFPV